mmetsp:Transcript_24005/g.55703  ORF Transcript_24005/g.55703 Transcript_24005/m.55703 type:complete len:201 (-) Transcript_24005:905-1507(-)
MLTQKETFSLLEILSHDERSLEVAAAAFQRTFVRADHFRVAAAMCIMLDDNMMLPRYCIAALYIIHDLYKNEPPNAHPFMPFLVGTLQGLAQSPSEQEQRLNQRNILCMLLATPQPKDLQKKTSAELSAAWKPGGEALPLPNLAALRQSYAERDAQVPELQRAGISPLVPDPQPLEQPEPEPSATDERGALDQRLGLLRL